MGSPGHHGGLPGHPGDPPGQPVGPPRLSARARHPGCSLGCQNGLIAVQCALPIVERKSVWILVVLSLKSAPRYRTCQYLFLFFKISFQNKPRIHQSISKAQIFWNHGLKCLWYHKKVYLKVPGLCKCRNKWRI